MATTICQEPLLNYKDCFLMECDTNQQIVTIVIIIIIIIIIAV